MKIRKLIHYIKLAELTKLAELGVPIKKLIRTHSIDISAPHLTKLIYLYKHLSSNIIVHCSLFPSWLTEEPTIQEQPKNYKYIGKFPYGQWIKDDEDA